MQCQLTNFVIVCNVLITAALLAVPWLYIPGLCSRCISSVLTGCWATAHHCLTDISSHTFWYVQERQSAAKGSHKGQNATAETAFIDCENHPQATPQVRRVERRQQAPGPLHHSALSGARKMNCTRCGEAASMIAACVKKAYIASPQLANKSLDSDKADGTMLPAGGAAL